MPINISAMKLKRKEPDIKLQSSIYEQTKEQSELLVGSRNRDDATLSIPKSAMAMEAKKQSLPESDKPASS